MYAMKIVMNEIDIKQSRIIIEVNGFEIDIIADADGLGIDVQKQSGAILKSIGIDWQ